MLNISKNNVNQDVDILKFRSARKVFNKSYYKVINKFLIAFAVIVLIILFLPWTQTVSSSGSVTTLAPNQRPHTIQSPIPGRIEKWHIREGDYVTAGDTILEISEVKSEYFDPNLVERTREQIDAKSLSKESYQSKAGALSSQIAALNAERQVKLDQAVNKLSQMNFKRNSDSTDLEAAKIQFDVSQNQLNREMSLQNEGLKSNKDVENMQYKFQEAQAKLVSAENKFLATKREVEHSKLEIARVRAEYADKIAKAESDLYTAKSSEFETSAQVSKLENEFSNYQIRNTLRYVIAPQNGYINKAIKSGIGETIKEGEEIIGIMPSNFEFAVESYVAPIDLPLINIGEKIRIQFDGWPAIVFSGWPNVSYGTYGGKVVAIENFISNNGKYRILIEPDTEDYDWPTGIRVGSGARTLALLDDVPIWFEIWRKLNGFPPNFYISNNSKENK